MAHKKYALIRISTGNCIYGKRLVDLPSHKLPVPGLDKDLKWYEMKFSKYPVIDNEKEGVTYVESLSKDFFNVDYKSFLIADGIKKPVTIPRGK
jgi:hypothetical protein